MSSDMPLVTIAADGSCLGNPGVGAWAIVIDRGGLWSSKVGTFSNTTNNIAELTAVIEAVLSVRPDERAVILSDSQLTVRGCLEWRFNWRRKGWRKGDGSGVANVELWKRLDALLDESGGRIRVEWVRGHNGHPQNEEADRLANGAARSHAEALLAVG